jgi:hypothetical protein
VTFWTFLDKHWGDIFTAALFLIGGGIYGVVMIKIVSRR